MKLTSIFLLFLLISCSNDYPGQELYHYNNDEFCYRGHVYRIYRRSGIPAFDENGKPLKCGAK